MHLLSDPGQLSCVGSSFQAVYTIITQFLVVLPLSSCVHHLTLAEGCNVGAKLPELSQPTCVSGQPLFVLIGFVQQAIEVFLILF